MIVEGVLERIASGTGNGVFIGREYIKVGGQRIPKVITSEYMDNILREEVASENTSDVKISLVKGLLGNNRIMAFKNSDGELHKTSIGELILLAVMSCFLLFLSIVLIGLILFGLFHINTPFVLIPYCVCLFLLPIVVSVKKLVDQIMARNAIE